MEIKKTWIYIKLSEYKKYLDYCRKIDGIKKKLGKVEKFTRKKYIPHNTIAIIEPNPFHAETLPGYIKYFISLGYNVDVFISYENAIEKPLNRMKDEFRVFIGDYKDIQKWIKYRNMNQYEFLFFNTLFYNLNHTFLPSLIKHVSRKRILGIVHGVEIYKRWLENSPFSSEYFNMLNNRQFATLTKMKGLFCVNPNYFGVGEQKNYNRNKIIFVSVGAIHPKLKNHDLLLDAVKNIVSNGITNFEVHIIGAGSFIIPEEYTNYIIMHGRLDFPSMFTIIENSDFMLALLDPKNKSQQSYLQGQTSGSLQLSYGFLKPLLINKLFADAYSLDSTNAVIYNDNFLYEAMIASITMSYDEYAFIKRNLEFKQNIIRKESLSSLKEMISRINN